MICTYTYIYFFFISSNTLVILFKFKFGYALSIEIPLYELGHTLKFDWMYVKVNLLHSIIEYQIVIICVSDDF